MKRQIATMFLAAAAFLAQAQTNVETQRQYISGTGCDDMVEWDFMCTGGRNSGKWTKIGVPSCWELQGFGTYQYGMRFYGKATPEGIADEKGLYKTEFTLPAEWEGREIYLVFEGSMTDTYATINGRKAGVGLHQGGFNRFMHNVSDRVFFGKKKNQSPKESMRQGMASCTGLAILLVDAYRAVGIPARFAGTLSWHDNRGNHSWTEVWLNGEWRVTEYYLPSKLDHLWFMPDASKAKVDDRLYAIYATRFGKANDWFPMIWAAPDETNPLVGLPMTIGGENVTQRYIDLAYEQYTRHIEAGTHTFLRIAGYANSQHTEHSGDRVAMGVDVFHGTEQMGGGLTAGPLRDMNDMFSVLLPKNQDYELRYYDAEGNLHRKSVTLKEEPITVNIFLAE